MAVTEKTLLESRPSANAQGTKAHITPSSYPRTIVIRSLILTILAWFVSTLLSSWPVSVPRYPDLYEASIAELQNGLESGHFTSVNLVNAYIARIAQVNLQGPKLRVVRELNPHALDQAKTLDEERAKSGKRSDLHGIPILLKDNIATLASEGMNTTAGSYALLGSVVPRDATVAAKLRDAGAIILGKTSMSEWAHFRGNQSSGWSARGGQGGSSPHQGKEVSRLNGAIIATNPYSPNGDPCGSSSGSGIASAIGLAAATLGTETDGSIICPSSRNNIVGIKPTVGLTSRAGVIPISQHQDSVGPMARSVSDAALLLSIIAGPDPLDNYTSIAPSPSLNYSRGLSSPSLEGKRFGVPRKVFTNDTITGNHPSINVAFERALEAIRGMGGTVVEATDVPHADDIVKWEDEMLVLQVDFKNDLAKYLEGLLEVPTGVRSLNDIIRFTDDHPELEKPPGYEDMSILLASESTKGYNSSYYEALARNYRNGGSEGIDLVLKKHDLEALVLPSEGYTSSLAAIAGYPIITVPLSSLPSDTQPHPHGPQTFYPAPNTPFGLSLIGSAWSEVELIQYAYAFEQKTRDSSRLGRRAYDDAIPRTQLADVIQRKKRRWRGFGW